MSKKETVLKCDINSDACQQKIVAAIGKLNGVQSISVDKEKKTVTVVGNVEPQVVHKALKKKKINNPEIIRVGPPKPKCRYCQYIQAHCVCGNPNPNPNPPFTYGPQSDYYWGPQRYELVAVDYPQGPGQCSIL